MTARSHPEQPDFASDAERVVWQALVKALPDHAHVVAGLRYSDGRGDGEADLVVAWPGVGVLTVEVKGGHVHRRDGGWRQSDRGESRDVDPVGQASRAKYAVFDLFAARHSERLRAEHLVAFPHSGVAAADESADCPRWRVLDCDDLDRVAERVKAALTRSGGGTPPPDQDTVDRLVEVLVGRPGDPAGLIAGQVAARDRVVARLTREQFEVLEMLDEQHRVEIRGGAGSGKTFLALEQARRLSARGRRVALLAYSRGLTRFLQLHVGQLKARDRPAFVGTFHSLGVGWGATPGTNRDPEHWERVLPAQMADIAAGLPESERFDDIVVDEAQDFGSSWWPVLLAALRNPETGGLYAFSDEGQTVFSRSSPPPVPLSPILLRQNLRNTHEIAGSFSSLTTRQQKVLGGHGAPVRFVPCAADEAHDVATDEVDRLLYEEGWGSDHIALLTTGHRHPICVERQQEGWDAYWDGYWAGDDIFYGHVLGFKGLERPAVVLGVDGFFAPTGESDDRAKEKLYVGMSRARDLLVVCGEPAMIRRVGGDGVAKRLGIG